MIGCINSLLHSENIGGVTVKLLVRLSQPGQSDRIKWTSSNIIAPNDALIENINSIISLIIDPIAECFSLPKPFFLMGFQKSGHHSYYESKQMVEDTSAGAAILVCMLSSMFRISLKNDIAITGSIDPPHSKIDWVRSIQEKVVATKNRADIKTIFIPTPDNTGMTKEEVLATLSQYGKTISLTPDLRDLFKHCFEEDSLFIRILNDPVIYAICEKHQQYDLPAVEAFYKTIVDIYNNKWGLLQSIWASNQTSSGHAAFEEIIKFYIANKDKRAEILPFFQRMMAFLSELGKLGIPADRFFIQIAKLRDLNDYDLLINLMLVYVEKSENSKMPDFNVIWTDHDFSDQMKEIMITMLNEKNYGQIIRLLRLLIRAFKLKEILPFIRRELTESIEDHLADIGAEIYAGRNMLFQEVVKWGNDPDTDNIKYKIEELKDKYNLTQCPGLINNAFNFVTKLFDIDPITAKGLAHNRIFMNIRGLYDSAMNTRDYPSPDRIIALMDITLFNGIRCDSIQFSEEKHPFTIPGERVAIRYTKGNLTIKISDCLDKLEFEIDKSALKRRYRSKNIDQEYKMVTADPSVLLQPPISQMPNYLKSPNPAKWNDKISHLSSGDDRLDKDNAHALSQLIRSFSDDNICYKYRNMNILWNSFYGPPPSREHFFVANILAKRGYLEKPILAAAEIDTNSGLLGIFLARNNDNIKELAMSSVSAKMNILADHNTRTIMRIRPASQFNYNLVTGFGLSSLEEFGPFDLAVSCTQFLPEKERFMLDTDLPDPLERTDMMPEIIAAGRKIAKEIIIAVSEIARPEFEAACKASGATSEKLDSIDIPFTNLWQSLYTPEELKITSDGFQYDLLRKRCQVSRAYIDFLARERGLAIIENEDFKYWQQFSVYSLRYD